MRLAADAVKNLGTAPQAGNPRALAQAALMKAAETHAPSLLAQAGGQPSGSSQPSDGNGGGHGHSGRWVRRGGKIVVLGA